jgi:hypothetical protein
MGNAEFLTGFKKVKCGVYLSFLKCLAGGLVFSNKNRYINWGILV